MMSEMRYNPKPRELKPLTANAIRGIRARLAAIPPEKRKEWDDAFVVPPDVLRREAEERAKAKNS